MGLRDLGGSGRRECRFTPKPARTESKFIDDHVATLTITYPAPISKAELPLVEIGTANGDRQAGSNDFGECGGAQQLLLYSPGDQQVESSTGTSGGQCGQLKHQYKAGDDRMESLLLTVWEAAERT